MSSTGPPTRYDREPGSALREAALGRESGLGSPKTAGGTGYGESGLGLPNTAGGTSYGVKVGDLASGDVAAAQPAWTLRAAACCMHERGVGSVVVLDHEELVGILTERDLLRAAAEGADLDATSVDELMTREVVTVAPDWEVYEAAAEMSAHHIRHLVVTEGRRVRGVLSMRDLLLAGQRVQLTGGHWAVLRDPLTFTVRERRRLQRCLLELEAGQTSGLNVDPLIGELVGSWSFDGPLPAHAEALASIDKADYELLRTAVIDELPNLQRAVQPAPGWRRWSP